VRELYRRLFDIRMVSPRNHMVFTPLLASTAVGTLDFRSVAEPVRVSFPHLGFTPGAATAIDTASRAVLVESAALAPWGASSAAPRLSRLSYDVLVVAVGSRVNTFGVAGVEAHAHFLKELSDAREIRQHLIRNVEAATFPGLAPAEQARLLHCLIVGGGPTGIELAAEMHDFLRDDLTRLFPEVAHLVRITIVEATGKVLGGFDDSLRRYAERRFRRDGIICRTGSAVRELGPTAAVLADGSVIPFGLCVWSTGVAPARFVAGLKGDVFRKDRWGRLVTNMALQVLAPAPPDSPPPTEPGKAGAPGAALSVGSDVLSTQRQFVAGQQPTVPGVYALGDCASVGDRQFASTAQVAEQQGRWLGRMLTLAAQSAGGPEALLALVPRDAFEYRHRGAMVILGRFAGITDFTRGGPVAPLHGTKLQGFTSWLLWRSAYLTKLGSWKNRVQVPENWARTFFFGRDVTQF